MKHSADIVKLWHILQVKNPIHTTGFRRFFIASKLVEKLSLTVIIHDFFSTVTANKLKFHSKA